jgi:hypothetical protein
MIPNPRGIITHEHSADRARDTVPQVPTILSYIDGCCPGWISPPAPSRAAEASRRSTGGGHNAHRPASSACARPSRSRRAETQADCSGRVHQRLRLSIIIMSSECISVLRIHRTRCAVVPVLRRPSLSAPSTSSVTASLGTASCCMYTP